MIEVTSIEFTTYEDGSVWLSYVQDDNYGYELRYPKNILNPIKEDKIPISNLKSKDLIYDTLDSSNEMLYIDEIDDVDYYHECKKLLNQDCELYPELSEHIEYEPYDDNTSIIVIYGSIITEVLF